MNDFNLSDLKYEDFVVAFMHVYRVKTFDIEDRSETEDIVVAHTPRHALYMVGKYRKLNTDSVQHSTHELEDDHVLIGAL